MLTRNDLLLAAETCIHSTFQRRVRKIRRKLERASKINLHIETIHLYLSQEEQS